MSNHEYKTHKVSVRTEIGRASLIDALDDYVHNAPVGELAPLDAETLRTFANVIETRLSEKKGALFEKLRISRR